MKPKEFLDQLDDAKIVAAIASAEQTTSGEIRVYVSHKVREDAVAAAQARFIKLGMTQTQERNAVLIYFAPRSQQFAIWGDAGVHEKCGQELWSEVATQMAPLLKAGRFTEAVTEAVKRVGAALAWHFPRRGNDRNELPNQVERD